jgi:alkaline phosphatase
MLGVNLYEEDVNTLVEEAMYCGKAGGVVSSVPMLHATPAAFITHANNRHSVEQLQRSFKQVNPTLASGICVASGKPDSVTLGSMKNGALSSQWTFLYQQDVVKAEHFYYPIEEFDPDNGDHVLVCLGGDYSESQMDSLPLRGVDSTYSNRWCSRGTVVKDPEHGTPVRVEPNSELCKNYNPEELTQIPHISNNVKAALDFLGKASGGFFLMYEQGDIDKSAHGNQMDDMLGQMLDMDDSVRVILDWIYAHGGWEKNALYVTADHDHYLTLEPDFPQKLAYLLIDGESHNITPKNNTGIAAWDLAIQAGRHKDDSKTQVEHIREFTTWSEQDIKNVGHFWGPRGGGGNAYSSHTTRPVPLSYMGDDGCIEKLMGKGYQVVGRRVEGTKDKIDHVHLHACMLKNLFGLSRLPVVPPGDKKDVVHDLVHTSSSSIKMAGSVWPLVLMIGWGLGSALW